MHYRKEIDGLRAFAVLPVILYHAGFQWLSGGYIGVDIFFVISGYLITSIILKELDAGTFSIAHFYERRARRILPALFFILLVSLPFAYFLLLPFELKDFGKSIISVIGFASNILFWQESDYFSEGAELIPLLHTWSLAVEEQFYVFFPLILMLFWALGKRGLVVIIGLIALASLGLTEWGWRHFPEANFYLIPTRAWELMIGSLSAFYLYYRDPTLLRNTFIEQAGSFIGLVLIIASILFLDKSIPFPSLYALAPTLGAAFIIIFTTPNTLAYRILALPIFVGIGLVSYSAYLWHQPLFVFTRIAGIEEPALWVFALLTLITFALAYLTWRFVEAPFRNKKNFTRKQIFTASFITSLIFVGLGIAFIIYADHY